MQPARRRCRDTRPGDDREVALSDDERVGRRRASDDALAEAVTHRDHDLVETPIDRVGTEDDTSAVGKDLRLDEDREADVVDGEADVEPVVERPRCEGGRETERTGAGSATVS